MPHWRIVCALCLYSSTVLVACSKDPPAASGAAPSAAPASAVVTSAPGARQELPPCSIVPLQDVETTLGVTGLKGPDTAGEWPVRACQFTGPPLNLPLVTVRFEVTRDLADFGKIRKTHEEHDQPTKDLPGLGEAAFTVEAPAHGVSFLYKKTVVFITTMRAPIDKQIALARMVMQRL